MAFSVKSTPLRDRVEKVIEDLNRTKLEVGWFQSTKYPDGTPVAGVAMVHEFGSPSNNIPPRPFMRPSQKKDGPRWRRFLADSAKRAINEGADISVLLDQLGNAVAGDIRKSISNVYAPPLRKKTVDTKRRKLVNAVGATSLTKPLVETGMMIGSVTHEVSKE